MRRFISFLLLFLVLSSLFVVTAPVRAEGTGYYALSFDGVDDYLTLPHVTALENQYSWSIGMIFYYAGKDGDLIDMVDGSEDEANNGWWVYITNGDIYYVYEYGNGSNYQVHFDTNLQPGRWYALVLRRTTSSVHVFLNNFNTTWAYSGLAVATGGGATQYARAFSRHLGTPLEGKLAVLVAWSGTISDSDVQAFFADPLNPPQDGLVLEYLPSSVDTVNGLWKDLSGNGNDGTIVGASYVPLRPVSESTPSASSPYGLSFGGTHEDDYVKVQLQTTYNFTQITYVALAKTNDVGSNAIIDTGNTLLEFRATSIGFWPDTIVPSVGASISDVSNKITLVTVSFDYDTKHYDIYLNNEKISSGTRTDAEQKQWSRLNIGCYGSGRFFDGNIYLVLIYNRALSDEEIKQIYADPLNPPKDGLVLFYSPYSYDPETGKWLNIAPIFPTIPLSEELDATNYGATAERVSIPSLHVYDIENNSEIPVENVSVSLIANNTTISLIPSLLTLPWNSTVTLNVSATNYLPRLLQTPTSITSLAVYLYPAPSENSTTTPPNWTNNFTMPDVNGTGWSGWQIGKEALSLNFDKAVQLFFTQNPNSKAQVFLPFAIWLGMTVLGLVFSQSPLVALTLGVITQASLAGLGAKLDMRLLPGVVTLYLFLFIWILKDFIESRKAD